MMSIILRCIVVFAIASVAACSGPMPKDDTNPHVVLETTLGTITVEIFQDEAPITSSNFLRYVDEQRLDSASWYRTVTTANQPNNDVLIEVIQGGLGRYGSRRLPAIEHETTEETGLRHIDGALSMARSDPGTASSEFFICIEDQPELDFGGKRNPDGQGFAVFGVVVEGMDVVRAIQNQPHSGQSLTPAIPITSVVRAAP